MPRSRITLRLMSVTLLLATLAHVTAARAQSSTTNVAIYGVLDAYGQYLDADRSLQRLQSGGLSASRFGLRGDEDLGGGLRAVFAIESGVNVDDGTNGYGAFWGRQAYVGLSSAYGSITLGRQYGGLYTLSTEFSTFGTNPLGPSTAVIGGFAGYEPVRGSAGTATLNGGPPRVNNSIKYESPWYAGFKVGALLGLGETQGSINRTRQADLYARYSDPRFDVMGSFVDDPSEQTGLDVRTASVAAAYNFGPARALAGFISVDDRSTQDADGRGYWIGGDYRWGSNVFRTQYVENKARNVNEGKTQAFGAGYQYDLSKRTSLYSSLTRFKNKGDGYANRISKDLPVGLTSAGERDVTEFGAGIRHSF